MSSPQAAPCSRALRKRRCRARFVRQFHWRSIQQAQAFLEAQPGELGVLLLLAEGLDHAAQPQGA